MIMTDNRSNNDNNAGAGNSFVTELLDAYFTHRRNLPGEFAGRPLMEEPKSTYDIIDDLTPMANLYEAKDAVVSYMTTHGYGFTTLADGSVKWAIWRIVEGDF